ESEFLEAQETLRAEFNTTRRVIGVLEAGSGNILDRDGLLALKRIENQISSNNEVRPYLIDHEPPVMTIAGPVEAALMRASNGSFTIENAPEPMLESIINLILQDKNVSRLVSNEENPKYGIVVINLRYNMIPADDETVEILLNDIIEGLDLEGYSYSSFYAVNTNMQKDAKETLSMILPISIFLVIVVLSISLRSGAKVIISLLGLLSIVIISFGLFSLLDLQFSQMMFFAPIVIIVLSIDYAIHLLHRFDEFVRDGLKPKEAMSYGVRFMGVSILLSTLTTALAFASNGLSNIPAVSSFGIFLAIGILISFLVMVLFVPSLLLVYNDLMERIRPKKRKRETREGPVKKTIEKGLDRPSATVTHFSFKYPISVVLLALLLMGGGLFLGAQVEKDMQPKDAMSRDSGVVRTIELLDDRFPQMGMETPFVLIEGDISDPEFMTTLDSCISGMADDEHIAQDENGPKVFSIINLVRSSSFVYNMSDMTGDGIPDNREDLGLILDQLYENGIAGIATSGKVRTLLSKGEGGSSFDMTLLMVEAKKVEGPRGGLLLDELEKDLEPLEGLDGVKISYSGFTFERYQMITEMTDGMIVSTFFTALLCTIVVIVLMRSVKFGLITALPIMFVIGWVLGSMYLLGYTLNMVTATITSMTVGIGVDYSIHLMERFRQEKRANGHSMDTMVRTIRTTGSSLVAAGLTTLAGFMVMAFSSIGLYRSFGVLASLMVFFSLVSTIIAGRTRIELTREK
ncbi:MAG: MMPL family transporter, partial [Candidatus Thermoplasmatota archaeon]|nr:MMPL family transporter [Candidatus Thermoplasmatota archaeon]